MNPHFFTAPFSLLSFGSGFKVQGSGFRWRLRRLFLDGAPPLKTHPPPASSSRAQPRDLSCTAAICMHAPSLKRRLGASFYRLSLTHVLPVCKKDPSTSALMIRKKDGSAHILFHTAA